MFGSHVLQPVKIHKLLDCVLFCVDVAVLSGVSVLKDLLVLGVVDAVDLDALVFGSMSVITD